MLLLLCRFAAVLPPSTTDLQCADLIADLAKVCLELAQQALHVLKYGVTVRDLQSSNSATWPSRPAGTVMLSAWCALTTAY